MPPRPPFRSSLIAIGLLVGCVALGGGCGHATPKPEPPYDADLNSGPDGKRNGAQTLRPNVPKTDEVSFLARDKTDWYVVDLKGKAGVLATEIHWDSESSDVLIDVFDAFGSQLAASPVRERGAKEKKLLTQIDKPGIYFIRVTAPSKADATVYTIVAKWDAPVEKTLPPPSEAEEPPPEHKHHVHEPHEAREPREQRPTGETIEGRIVTAYREGGGLTLHLDKGAAVGLKVGMSGTVLSGPSGEQPLDGGSFKITQVLDPSKSVAKTTLHSIGRNTRVLITLGR